MAYVHTIKKTMKGIVSYCEKRDAQIWKFYQKGWTMNELADRYHITQVRVWQIINKARSADAKKVRRAS